MRNPIGAAGISLIACALAASAWAGAGSDGAAFLQLPLGARAAALGGAYDALATDAYAPAWNPAGLAFEPSASVSASYLSYLDAMSYDAFSAAVPLRNGGDGGVGGSIQYFDPGSVPASDVAGNPIGRFNGYY